VPVIVPERRFKRSRWEERAEVLIRGAAVPIEVAAELADVQVSAIRRWASIGSLEVESRGDMEVVRLDRVRYLASVSPPRRDRGDVWKTLRGLLRGAELETPSVLALQRLAQERSGDD
jgi:hypothetical protein